MQSAELGQDKHERELEELSKKEDAQKKEKKKAPQSLSLSLSWAELAGRRGRRG